MEGSPKSPEQLYSEHREDAENLEKSKSEYDKHLAEAKEAGDINKHPELREQASAEYLAETKEKIAEAVKAGNYEGAEKLLHDIQTHLAVKEVKETTQDGTMEIVGKEQNYIGINLIAGENIRVLGNVGDGIGDSMSGGEIYVGGTVRDNAGHSMSGGKIHVEGNAGDLTGNYMSGGEIHITGNANHGIGNRMSGGEIHIGGSAGDWTGDSISGGKIHVEGDVGKWNGRFMSGGILRIDGEVASFDESAFTSANRGTIIWKGEIIWKNGQKSEPGWTNLKVEKKIAFL